MKRIGLGPLKPPAEERIAESLEKLTSLMPWIMTLLTLITIAVIFK